MKVSMNKYNRGIFINNRLTKKKKEALLGYMFISPWLVGLLLFYLGPIIAVFALSFTNYDFFSSPNWVGLKNYLAAFSGYDELFSISLYNTLYFVIISVPLSLIIGFILALLINSKIKGRNLFRAVFYAPAIIPLVAACTIWSTLFAPQHGLINYILEVIGISGPNWFSSQLWAKPAIIIMSLWNVGEVMVVFLAGLQGIPNHLYEAGKIDGATGIKALRYITIPMMTPTILFNLVLRTIRAFQVFQTAYVLTDGGPRNATRFLALHLYKKAFETLDMGYASALAVVLFLIVFIFALIVFKTSNTWVYYASKK